MCCCSETAKKFQTKYPGQRQHLLEWHWQGAFLQTQTFCSGLLVFFRLDTVHSSWNRCHCLSHRQLITAPAAGWGQHRPVSLSYTGTMQSLNFLTSSRAHFNHERNLTKLEILAIKECPYEKPASKWFYPSVKSFVSWISGSDMPW